MTGNVKLGIFLLLMIIGSAAATVEDSEIVIENLGCWKDTGGDRAIRPIEGEHSLLKDSYGSRTDAYKKCLKAALFFGYRVFAIQNGGWCASAAGAEETYKKHGGSNACLEDGEGGFAANQVYKITFHDIQYSEWIPVPADSDRGTLITEIVEGKRFQIRTDKKIDSGNDIRWTMNGIGNSFTLSISTINSGLCSNGYELKATEGFLRRAGDLTFLKTSTQLQIWFDGVLEVTWVYEDTDEAQKCTMRNTLSGLKFHANNGNEKDRVSTHYRYQTEIGKVGVLLNVYQPEKIGYMKVGDVGTNVVCTTNIEEATRFEVVEGLHTAYEGAVSFRVMGDSKNVYLRHQGFVLKTVNVIYSGTDNLIGQDASFLDVPGLSGGKDEISFKSGNYPDKYIRYSSSSSSIKLTTVTSSASAKHEQKASWMLVKIINTACKVSEQLPNDLEFTLTNDVWSGGETGVISYTCKTGYIKTEAVRCNKWKCKGGNVTCTEPEDEYNKLITEVEFCKICPPKTYHDSGNNICKTCPKGHKSGYGFETCLNNESGG